MSSPIPLFSVKKLKDSKVNKFPIYQSYMSEAVRTKIGQESSFLVLTVLNIIWKPIFSSFGEEMNSSGRMFKQISDAA